MTAVILAFPRKDGCSNNYSSTTAASPAPRLPSFPMMVGLAIFAFLFCAAPASAQHSSAPPDHSPGASFDRFLSASSPACVPVAEIEAAAVAFTPLNDSASAFIAGFYVAIPPMSKDLPAGRRGELARDASGQTLAFITDGAQSCARFLAPPFLLKMIEQEQLGVASHAGEGL